MAAATARAPLTRTRRSSGGSNICSMNHTHHQTEPREATHPHSQRALGVCRWLRRQRVAQPSPQRALLLKRRRGLCFTRRRRLLLLLLVQVLRHVSACIFSVRISPSARRPAAAKASSCDEASERSIWVSASRETLPPQTQHSTNAPAVAGRLPATLIKLRFVCEGAAAGQPQPQHTR